MKWIKVKDKLPEIEQDVLAYCISHGEPTEFGFPNTYKKNEKYISIDQLCLWNDTKNISFRTNRFYGVVTHWMPIPEAPEE